MNRLDVFSAKILIVDDEPPNVRLLERILSRAGYANVWTTLDSRQVAPMYIEVQPDIILLDLMMPHFSGFEVMEQLRAIVPNGMYLPILVLTADIAPEARERALSNGARDFLLKPFDHTEVLLRIRNLVETRLLYSRVQGQNEILEIEVRNRTREIEESQIEILSRLARAGEFRDDDTGQHTQRVGHASSMLARHLGFSPAEVELVQQTAPLHDVGKIGVSDSILLKPGRLTPEELAVMRTHTTIGAALLSGGHSDLVLMAETIARTHHERWDGQGYPAGLAGEEIPLIGRIVSIVDVFDALTHERPYKRAWPLEEALIEVASQRGQQFDPRVVDAFLKMHAAGSLQVPDAITDSAIVVQL